jgi:hypothetical protein
MPGLLRLKTSIPPRGIQGALGLDGVGAGFPFLRLNRPAGIERNGDTQPGRRRLDAVGNDAIAPFPPSRYWP